MVEVGTISRSVAERYQWRMRERFFVENQNIARRRVQLELAEEVDVPVQDLERDLDGMQLLWEDHAAESRSGCEGVQSWFDSNASAEPANGVHNHVDTRAELLEYDPTLAALVKEVFGETKWRFSCP